MESTLQDPALAAAKTTAKAETIVYWIVTTLFCLQIGFTAYAQLRLPQVADAFIHLGFPAYFRVELSWAKLLGVVLLLAPVGRRKSPRRTPAMRSDDHRDDAKTRVAPSASA